MNSFKLKFNEGDKCIIVGYADMIDRGEVVRIKRLDYNDTELPYLVKSLDSPYESWVEQNSLKILQNSIKKL